VKVSELGIFSDKIKKMVLLVDYHINIAEAMLID